MAIGLDCWHTAMTVALPSFMESLLSPLVRPLSSVYVRLSEIAYWRLPLGVRHGSVCMESDRWVVV